MKIIQITEQNIDTEHICCAIGNDKVNKLRAESKKDWMKQQFKIKFIRMASNQIMSSKISGLIFLKMSHWVFLEQMVRERPP